jgi:adenosine deaminase
MHVLTTASERIDPGITEIRRYFAQRFPNIRLTVTRVDGFDDLRSEEDHYRFEEVLYRWILETAPDPTARYVCLAGGYKTIAAAMQKAAAVLGAAEVFHVLADLATNIAELVDKAVAAGQIRYVRLGSESGWPQLRSSAATDYPLDIVSLNGNVRSVRTSGHRFRDHLHEIVERSHRIAGAWERLTELPFVELATWSEADLTWLSRPLHAETDAAWVRALPKIELHCHLGGFGTHGPDLALVRAAAEDRAVLPPVEDHTPPAAWPRPAQACSLTSYLRLGDNNGSRLLRDPGCLRRQCELLYQRLVEDHVVYAEIRCSPNNYADPSRGRSALDVLRDIRETFQRSMAASRELTRRNPAAPPACHVNLIVIATRKQSGGRSDISRHLALAITGADQWTDPDTCRVVGVDLAGFESPDMRAALFQIDFEPVHRVGLAVTVHAGENDDAEGIWQAVFKLNTRRLGHALHLGDAPDLLRAVADRGIAVEMCPFSNLQIRGFAPVQGGDRYPLLDYLRQGLRVTANTDNLGISGASLSENLLLLADLCPGLNRLDVLRLERHALDAAFLPAQQRLKLLATLTAALPRP